MNGQEISEEQIDQWVAEAEAGYDPAMLRRRGRPTRASSPSRAITVRLTDTELEGIEKYARQHDLTRSGQFVRLSKCWCHEAPSLCIQARTL